MDIVKFKEKLESKTPGWVNVHLDSKDEEVNVRFDLRKLVESTDTKVDDHILDILDQVVSHSQLLLPLLKSLFVGLDKPKSIPPKPQPDVVTP